MVYHRSLFLTIRDKFGLSYLIFAASTVKPQLGAVLITRTCSLGSANGLGKQLVLEAEHGAPVRPFLGKHFNFAVCLSCDHFSKSISR